MVSQVWSAPQGQSSGCLDLPWLTVGPGARREDGAADPFPLQPEQLPRTCCIRWTSLPGSLYTKGPTVPNGLKTSLWQCAPSGVWPREGAQSSFAACPLSASPESSQGGGCRLGETCPYPELPEQRRDGWTGTGGLSADLGRGLLCPPAVLERVGGCACVCTHVTSVCICVFRMSLCMCVVWSSVSVCMHVSVCLCMGEVSVLCVYASVCVCVCVCVCLTSPPSTGCEDPALPCFSVICTLDHSPPHNSGQTYLPSLLLAVLSVAKSRLTL